VIDARIEIYGLKEALLELQTIAPKARWAAVNSLKAASSTLVSLATETYPSDSAVTDQLKGAVHKGRTGYQQTRATRNVKVKVGGKRTSQGEPVIFSVAGMRDGSKGKPMGPDRLGRKRQKIQSETYVRKLQQGFGQGQRGMWKNYKAILKEAEGELMDAIRKVAAKVNRKIVR